MRTKGATNREVDWEQRGRECRARQAERLYHLDTDLYEAELSRAPWRLQRMFTRLSLTFGREEFKIEDVKPLRDGDWQTIIDLTKAGFVVVTHPLFKTMRIK